MPYFEKTDAGAVVPYTGEVPMDAINAIERADEASLTESFRGGFAQEHLLYSFEIPTKTGKRLIVGINVSGSNEIARLLGNIEVLPDVKVTERDDYFYGMVRVKDLIRNVTLLGTARQSMYVLTEHNEPTSRKNEFAYVIALSKAQRNGILSVAPQEAVIKVVQQFIEQKKLGRLAPPKQTITGKVGTEERPKEQLATKPTGEKAAAATKDTKTDLNRLKAAFMMGWREWQGMNVWTDAESDAEREKWLKERFGKESTKDLTVDELRKAKSAIDGDVAALNATQGRGEAPSEVDPITTTEERREMAEYIIKNLGISDQEGIKALVVEATDKRKDWTRSDLQKVKKVVDERRTEGEQAPPATEETKVEDEQVPPATKETKAEDEQAPPATEEAKAEEVSEEKEGAEELSDTDKEAQDFLSSI